MDFGRMVKLYGSRFRVSDNDGGMVSCLLRATFISIYGELQAGGNASN